MSLRTPADVDSFTADLQRWRRTVYLHDLHQLRTTSWISAEGSRYYPMWTDLNLTRLKCHSPTKSQSTPWRRFYHRWLATRRRTVNVLWHQLGAFDRSITCRWCQSRWSASGWTALYLTCLTLSVQHEVSVQTKCIYKLPNQSFTLLHRSLSNVSIPLLTPVMSRMAVCDCYLMTQKTRWSSIYNKYIYN